MFMLIYNPHYNVLVLFHIYSHFISFCFVHCHHFNKKKGYEGSLLKVTSKNGKTSSVSLHFNRDNYINY